MKPGKYVSAVRFKRFVWGTIVGNIDEHIVDYSWNNLIAHPRTHTVIDVMEKSIQNEAR